ncbi:hypothetical protein Patl1_37500 [Pistacia atlantica]|nr:hypothetical protein Patl1_37500 [Pistacia atlantica]
MSQNRTQEKSYLSKTRHCPRIKGNWGYKEAFGYCLRAARLYTAWLRYRSYVVVDLQSSLPAIPECLLSSARSFARSKQDEVALLFADKARSVTSSCSTRLSL